MPKHHMVARYVAIQPGEAGHGMVYSHPSSVPKRNTPLLPLRRLAQSFAEIERASVYIAATGMKHR